MKKYFMFVAVAAAGMLASCSSESLTGSDPKIDPTQEDLVPIEISVANNVSKGTTRGVGTVGDIEDAGTVALENYWQGEKVNVFMFEKTTLTPAKDGTGADLYNDVALTTPSGSVDTGIANEIYNDGVNDRVRYKYYPISGNFDFWGYYIDDALPVGGAVTYGATEVTVPFEINGTQDLMVAKAELTTAQGTIMNALPIADQTRYYSAFAARKNVQPNMAFKHLLTRLTFSILAGNNAARGFKESTPGAGDWSFPVSGVYDGVFVKSIKVKSRFSGKIVAAYTSSSAAAAGTVDKLIEFDQTTLDPTDASTYHEMELKSGQRNGANTQVLDLYDSSIFTDWDDNAVMTPLLTIGNANFGAIQRPTDLTTTDVRVGGALLVSPEDSYDIEVVLGQYLLESDDLPGAVPPAAGPAYKMAYATYKTTINPTGPAATFEQGTSYNVKMTLYGFERIEITTTLEAWNDGGNVPVVAD